MCSGSKTNNDIAQLLVDPEKGLGVDYKGVEKERVDNNGKLTWTLSLSSNAINE